MERSGQNAHQKRRARRAGRRGEEARRPWMLTTMRRRGAGCGHGRAPAPASKAPNSDRGARVTRHLPKAATASAERSTPSSRTALWCSPSSGALGAHSGVGRLRHPVAVASESTCRLQVRHKHERQLKSRRLTGTSSCRVCQVGTAGEFASRAHRARSTAVSVGASLARSAAKALPIVRG